MSRVSGLGLLLLVPLQLVEPSKQEDRGPALAGGQAAEGQKPTFPGEVELVTVDVVVTDRQGNPVRGLGQGDFAVSEDGVPQVVAAFEAVERPAPPSVPSAPTPRRTSSNRDVPAREGRAFVVVFDELHLEPAEAQRARAALADFLKGVVADRDRVSLVGTAGGTWWTARMPEGGEALLEVLGRLRGRRAGERALDAMSDYEALRIDRDRDPIVTERVRRRFLATGAIRPETRLRGDRPDEGEDLDRQRSQVQARAAQVYARAAARAETTLAVLERSLVSLAAVRGRKSMILVSGGLVHDPRTPGFGRVVTESRRANTAVYFLDARGLAGAPSTLRAEAGPPTDSTDLGAALGEDRERSEGSEALAADTGGFSVRGENDLAPGLARIGRESGSYYLLGYAPTSRRADGRFRRIEVKLAREGAVVRARRGYYAPAPGRAGEPAPREGRDDALQRALDSPFELPDVPLRSTTHVFGEAAPGRTMVLVTAEADIRGLAFEERSGAAKDALELLLLVVQRETGEFHRFDQQLEMSLRPETRARLERTWLPITRELKLPAGAYQARIVARDRNSGRIGSLAHDFDVPPPTGLRVSTPILSDRLREDGPAASRTPDPIARRSFAPSGLLHCRFEVYGFARDPRTGRPNVTAGFAVRRDDGRILAAMAETPLEPGPDGSLARTLGTPLDGAPPGRYEVIVPVTDIVAGQAAEAREPFVVEAAGAPEAGSP